MRGGLKLVERGVIPRLLSAIYRRGRKVAKDSSGETSVSVTLSYYEIYNDKVFDLFEPPEKRTPSGLPLREKDGKTIVVGLSQRSCNDLKEFEQLYIEANNNRSVGSTKLNAQSSRSHAILMVTVSQTTGDEVRTSTASAIDLAGSEDNRRTDNGKERLVESASINKSLFVLSQCIDAISRSEKRIPYRESKMTRILSLGQNNGITIMILNLAPIRSYHLDTLSSLNVSSRAKRIEVREIENEVVYKQPPRTMSSIAGSSMNRQPLRPLTNAHNAHVNSVSDPKKAAEKPPKAFSVYSDRKSRPSQLPQNNKRPAETMNARPSKMVRPNTATSKPSAPELSAAKIEEMVEAKVSEILAKRALDQPAPVVQVDSISETVQKRLDALEKKIDGGSYENAKAEGLRFLLMAKQHKERGEDSSALKMYELAQPFFPTQEKLVRKIEALKAKIKAKRDRSSGDGYDQNGGNGKTILQLPTPASSFQESPREEVQPESKSNKSSSRIESEYYHDPSFHADEASDDEDTSYINPATNKSSKSRNPKPKQSKPKTQLQVFNDPSTTSTTSENEPQTPRTKHLLDIVNSRDVGMIMGLNGFGAKKARDLVEFLGFMDEEEGGRVSSLGQLRGMPGLGGKTVERAYEGIGGRL